MDALILSNDLLIPVAFLIGIITGFFVGKKMGPIKEATELWKVKKKMNKIYKKINDDKLKVLRKSEPKTFEQKRSEALDEDKPIIKTFYK